MNFLWDKSEALNGVLSYDYGGMIKNFCEYRGDDAAFQFAMERYAEAALQKAAEYREFKSIDYAKRRMEQKIADTPDGCLFWEVYDFAMLCFLAGNYDDGHRNLKKFLHLLRKDSYAGDAHILCQEDFYNQCVNTIAPRLTSEESARKLICEMINRRRAFFRAKPSFKKMDEKDFCAD